MSCWSMSIQTSGPFGCGGGPMRHSFASAGAATIAAPDASTVRRVNRVRMFPSMASSP